MKGTRRASMPLLLSVTEAARRLRVHVKTLRAMIRRGDVPVVRFGRTVRVYAPALGGAAPMRRHARRRSA